ncbi:MAG: hypothetical protein WAM14_22645 [Candidatus Nitrosopolaris sp.]
MQNSKAESNIKNGFIEKLNKFKDKLEEQAIDYILTAAKAHGRKAIPILIELMKSH